MTSVTTLSEFAAELLEECTIALATTSGGAPDRTLISPSVPALDCCPMLAVDVRALGLEGTAPTAPGPVLGHRTFQGQLTLATLVATFVRCTPQPTGGDLSPPTQAALTVVSSQIQEDVWAVWNHLTNLVRAKELFAAGCMAVYLDGATPINEAGACAGWTVTVRAAISGYNT